MRAAVSLIVVASLAAAVAAGAGAASKRAYTGTYTSSKGDRFRLTVTVSTAPAVHGKRLKSGKVQLNPDSTAVTVTVRNLRTDRRASVIAPPVTIEVDAIYPVPHDLGGGYAALSAGFTNVKALVLRPGGTAHLQLNPAASGALLTVPAGKAAAFKRVYRGTPAYVLVGAFGAALGERDAVRKGTDCQGYVLAFSGRAPVGLDAAACDRLTALRQRTPHP